MCCLCAHVLQVAAALDRLEQARSPIKEAPLEPVVRGQITVLLLVCSH